MAKRSVRIKRKTKQERIKVEIRKKMGKKGERKTKSLMTKRV